MRIQAGSQPGCALLGLHLAFGVSGHSSLQLCQLGAVTQLSRVVGGAQHCSPLRCPVRCGRQGPALDLTSLPQLVLHDPPPSTYLPEGVARIQTKSWIGMS